MRTLFRFYWLLPLVLGVLLVSAGLAANRLWPRPQGPAPSVEREQPETACGNEAASCCLVTKPDALPPTPNPPDTPAEATVAAKPADAAPGFDPDAAGRLAPRNADPPADPPAVSLEMKRRRDFTEEDLRRQLEWAPDVGIGSVANSLFMTYAKRYRDYGRRPEATDPWLVLMKACPDVATLPVRLGDSCRLNGSQAANLQVLAQKLRVYLNTTAPLDADGKRPEPVKLREAMKLEMRGKTPEWLRAEAIPAMMQLLMHEDTPVRLMLVDILAEIPGKQATVALAQRAVFDLTAEARDAAVRALKDRSRAESRDVFLKGLRYPWSPAADHAAEALVALDDKDAVPQLVNMLKMPDPSAPVLVGKYYLVQEVVRANHTRNCLLCHPPAYTSEDPCLGLDPFVVNPCGSYLRNAAASLSRSPGSHSYGVTPVPSPVLIRGDITYLRQDLSVQQPMPIPGTTRRQNVRFDYLVRTHFATAEDLKKAKAVEDPRDYEQREAVLFALRGLTGQDAGRSTEAWRRLFPAAEDQVEAEKLTRELLDAPAQRREQVLTKLRDAKGVANTVALADAIPQLKGPLQEKARDALVERMTRMTADTLRDKFRDDDLEVRRAALQAAVRKADRGHVPDLIALLEDDDPLLARMALAGLKTLTDQNLDTPGAWKEWWQKQSP